MLKNEAIWFGKQIKRLEFKDNLNGLDLAGGNYFFRHFRQWWIEKYIFRPLENKNIKIAHTDIKLDVLSKDFKQDVYKKGNFSLIFAFNLLEHVFDYKLAAKNISNIIPKDGYLFISCPSVFPFHPCPIDNLFRPSVDELEKLFPKLKVVAKKSVSEKRLFTINRASFLWLNRTFVASCLVLKRK